jgi:hypothetical protein
VTAPVSQDANSSDVTITLGALGILAYVASMMTHEALGHGAFCLRAGGHNVMLGDSAVLIAGLSPRWPWRTLLVVVGAFVYYLSMRVALLELRTFLGSDDDERLRHFLWIPYLTAGLLACCAGALNRTMAPGTALGLAAASSFGAGFGMLRLRELQRRVAIGAPVPGRYIRRSFAWVVAAIVVGAGFVFVLGPGIGERPG